jgi:Reverse transcriptase (RNA-dependent DNA polymerase)
MCSGVRQGSTLSPALFNLFINAIIVKLKSSSIGCRICDQYFGCLLYADDLILLSPSVVGLQDMLNICQDTATLLALNFNVMKCHCIAFGKNDALRIDPLSIGCCKIDWYDSFNYLGVNIVAGKRLSFDIDPVKRTFYSAYNCVFSQAGRTDEILHLSLQETYCSYFTVCFTRLFL